MRVNDTVDSTRSPTRDLNGAEATLVLPSNKKPTEAAYIFFLSTLINCGSTAGATPEDLIQQ
jgi:hypothetical protein